MLSFDLRVHRKETDSVNLSVSSGGNAVTAKVSVVACSGRDSSGLTVCLGLRNRDELQC